MIVPGYSAGDFVPLNGADNWPHLLLTVGIILLGVVLGRRRGAHTSAPEASSPGGVGDRSNRGFGVGDERVD